jgi:MFS family permease
VGSPLSTFTQVAGNRPLLRVVGAYGLFSMSEYAVWIAILVYAYGQGGATTAGLVVVAQLLPGAVVAPLVAPLADRHSPVRLLLVGYVVQTASAVGTAVLLFSGAPSYSVYLGAVLVSTAISTTRPAQTALVPALTREVHELTGANVLLGWVESVSLLLAGAGVGVTLTVGSVAGVFVGSALLLATAVLLVVPLSSTAIGQRRPVPEAASDGGVRAVLGDRQVRLLLSLLAAEFVVVGALDVLFVVLAIDVLDSGKPWVGYLNMAYGAGGVILGSLGPVIVATAALLGLALAATALVDVPLVVVVLLALVGGSRALFDAAGRTLLQRTTPAHHLGRIFGVEEGLGMLGLAVGAVLAPALISLGGPAAALVGVASVLPAIVLWRGRVLTRLDQQARVPVVEIALLRSLPLFRSLPPPALEGLAQALERVEFGAGDVLVREGEEGSCYYAIVDGDVEVQRAGRSITHLQRGDGLGEIALLRTGRRTATASATTPVRAFRLDRDAFLTAVNGHVPTLESADALVSDVEARDARRDTGRDA